MSVDSRRSTHLSGTDRDVRDPESIEILSLPAARYADEVERLAREARMAPLARLDYGAGRGQWLDVYAPPGASDLPVLVFLHGGAWINGHLGWLRFMAPAVTALPAIFVATTYRLAPRCRWPAQYEDACAALSLVIERIGEFGGDPRRIVLAGHSAGGHLAALLTLKQRFAGCRACFPVSSPFDLQYGDVAPDSHENRVYQYLLSDRRQDREASPIEFVSGNTVPFHLIWGERDLPHIVSASVRMAETLRVAGCPVSYEIVPSATHFDTHLSLRDAANPWYGRLRKAFA
ncbi:MAG TPA: alpha/beta hydrolase [Steroidobacteraceae bacterium]